MFLQYEQEVQFCDYADINSVCDLHCIEVGWGLLPNKVLWKQYFILSLLPYSAYKMVRFIF